MKKSRLLGAVCACVAFVSVSANAATIDFAVLSPTAGSISYAGGSAPLVGSDIEVDTIVGLGTLLNPDVPVSCDSCVLNFVTGANAGGWDFNSGGNISIVGGVSSAGIVGGTTLLSGSFDTAVIIDAFSIQIAGAVFSDTKDEDLLTYFGLPLGNYQGGLNISFSLAGTPSTGDAFTSNEVFSGDVINDPVIPVPAAIWLFGSGLIGLLGVAKRKKS